MRKFIIKRLLLSILILFLASIIFYGVLNNMPSDFFEVKAIEMTKKPGNKLTKEEWVKKLEKEYGKDPNLVRGYCTWMKKALTLEFGESWHWNVDVLEKFKDVIGNSFFLALAAFILQTIIAIPLGILAARKQYSKTDYAVTVFALIGISIPGFFFATILKYILSVKLGWLDLYGAVGRFHDDYNFWGQMWDTFLHYLMPILTLTVTGIGSLMRYTRTNMLEVLNSDYIRTARAKGLPEKTVINKHAFRNTLIPLVTILGGSLPGLFGGAMITETIFQIPGIGYTSYQSIIKGDIPFAMFYLMFSAILILVSTFITDILYAVVDPRVRVQ
ncbi:MAG: ABC transporter permease [Lachnospiraceae bacterium]|nr:ABC transporter permease [Lachnospiraceae bacterium]